MSERAAPSDGQFWGATDETTALQRYRTLVNTIDDGLYQLDAEGRFVAVNDIVVEVTGYSRDELVGEHVSLLLDSDDIERIEREIREGLSTDRDGIDGPVFEVAIETADGERVPVELRVNPLLEDGTFRGTVGVARDVSDRKRREERAETAVETYETLTSVLDEADVGVFVLDESLDVAWIDSTAEEYFGLDREAVIGRDKRELIEETIRHRVADGEAFADTVLATYEDNSYDERFDCRVTSGPNREERWLEHRSKPLESGRYAGGRVELYYDVTDQRRRATQLRRLNEAVNEWLEESSREAVAERASAHLRDILGMEINGVFLHDPDANSLRPVSWTETADALFGEPPTFEAGEGIAWRVFESGEPRIYDEVSDAPAVYDPDTPVRSEMVFPIGDHGVAIIGARERDAFDDGDLMLAKVAASSLEATFDRLRHERRLERERDLTDQILEATPVGTLVLDADGEVTRINDRAIDLFDVDDPDAFDPSDRPMYDEGGNRLSVDDYPFATALETGEPVYERILRVERADGDGRWLSVDAVPITDEDGGIDRVVTTGEDVTDLKERERELETELSEIFGRVSDGFYALDEEYRFTHLNERAAELLGVTEAELRGRRLEEVYPETSELETVREYFDEAMETQEPTSLEHYSELLGFWVEATVYPSESGVSVYFRDVTERRERERQLREREQRLERYKEYTDDVLDAIDDVFYILDEDGELVRWNESLSAVTGYDEDEIAEMHATEFVAGDHRDAVADAVREGFETGSVTLEVALSTRDDDRIPYEFDASRLEDPWGNTVLAGIGRDVTDRKERERELEESERRLRTLIEHFPNGAVALVDEDLRYVTFGGSPVGTADVAGSDLEGKTPREALSRELADVVVPHYEAAIEGESAAFESEVGDSVYQFYFTPVRDEDGDVFAAMGMSQDVAEQKERERELREAKSQLEAAIEAGAVGTWEWHVPEDRFVAGASFARTFDVDPEAAREGVSLERFVSAIHEDDRERVETAIDEALETCGEYEAEYRVRNADGELRWVVARGRVECDEDGEPVRFPGAVADITERKRAERELERTKRQLETLIEVLPVGVVVADADGALVRANDASREIWGDVFDAEDVTDYSRFTGWWADSGEPVAPEEWTMARVLDGETVTDPDVYEIETADGERRTIEVRGLPIRNADGEIVRGVVTQSDVTERREYRRRLETSERRHRTLVENFPDGAVALFDEDLEYTAVGGQYFDETGVDPDERIGNSVLEIYPDDLVADLEPNFRATLAGEEREFEVEFNDRHLRLHTVPVEDATGEIYAGMIVAQDVTERREYRRRLEESNERLEQFAYAVSHDLQEPLRMVTSYLQLLESRYEDELDDDAEEFIEFAVDGAERMRAMIDGLLEYSRVTTRGDPLEPVDLERVVDEVLADLQLRIEETDAEITTAELPRVEGDADQLRQVFQNLFENAIEYSGDEPPRIRVGAERDGDEWTISVRDEGIGIDPEDQDRIFEVFERLHTREEHSGTGIGLALCQRIVERHGGEIRVDSEPGEGATFSFTLPAADS